MLVAAAYLCVAPAFGDGGVSLLRCGAGHPRHRHPHRRYPRRAVTHHRQPATTKTTILVKQHWKEYQESQGFVTIWKNTSLPNQYQSFKWGVKFRFFSKYPTWSHFLPIYSYNEKVTSGLSLHLTVASDIIRKIMYLNAINVRAKFFY